MVLAPLAEKSCVPEVQTERAFLKQQGVSLTPRRIPGRKEKKPRRHWRRIGLGFETPKAAITGNYIDKKCPFTGKVSIRGKILKGMIVSTKMKRTVIVRISYLHFVRKYNRFEKRHSNIPAHCSPAFEVKEGYIATVGQCRPLSKTVRFNVVKVEPHQIFGAPKKQFALF